MGLIAPGKNVVCIESVECVICGLSKASRDAIYMCEEIGGPIPFHGFYCGRPNCDGFLIAMKGKDCGLCACCFKPLDDGDTSMVAQDDMEKVEAWERSITPERVA